MDVLQTEDEATQNNYKSTFIHSTDISSYKSISEFKTSFLTK